MEPGDPFRFYCDTTLPSAEKKNLYFASRSEHRAALILAELRTSRSVLSSQLDLLTDSGSNRPKSRIVE